MERGGQHTIFPRFLDQNDVKRVLEDIPPVRADASDLGGAKRRCDAYHRPPSPIHAHTWGELDVADRPPRARPIAWALVPNAALVEDAVATGRGSELIALWDELSRTAPWSTLAAAYGAAHEYCSGGAVEAHHRAKAASGGFDIVSVDHAIELRAKLLAVSKSGGGLDLRL